MTTTEVCAKTLDMNEMHWMRSSHATVFEQQDSLTILAHDGVIRRLHGDSATLARAVLEFLARPHTRGEVLHHLETLSGGPIEDTTSIDQLLRVLAQSGAISQSSSEPSRTPLPQTLTTRVLVCATGAVGSIDVPILVRLLQSAGCVVRVAMTRDATRFLRVRALEALTHQPVHTSLWNGRPDEPAPHIALSQWAQIVVIAPCSATTLSRLAAGDFSDIVSAVSLTTRAPVVLAPSMNPAMLCAPAVMRNLDLVRQDGFVLVHPQGGFEVAQPPSERTPITGVMPSPDRIVRIVNTLRESLPPAESPRLDWEAIYSSSPWEQLPFVSPRPDSDMLDRIAALNLAHGAHVLDAGCGVGVLSRHLASSGHSVWGVDVSPTAIAIAQQLDQDARVHWRVGDLVTGTALQGLPQRFKLVVDRATMHTIDPSLRPRYIREIASRLEAGSSWIVKCHSESGTMNLGTSKFSPNTLEQAVLPYFRMDSCAASQVDGNLSPQPPALLAHLVRTDIAVARK